VSGSKSEDSLATRCVTMGKSAALCLRKPVGSFSVWAEVVLFVLILVGYFLLKNFIKVSFAPIVGMSPIRDPILVMEPFIFIVLAFLAIQVLWKSCVLGFILAITICLASLCFIVAIMAMLTVNSAMTYEYFGIIVLPIIIFAIAVTMGKKYQSGLCR
jgi:hypothetical protein